MFRAIGPVIRTARPRHRRFRAHVASAVRIRRRTDVLLHSSAMTAVLIAGATGTIALRRTAATGCSAAGRCASKSLNAITLIGNVIGNIDTAIRRQSYSACMIELAVRDATRAKRACKCVVRFEDLDTMVTYIYHIQVPQHINSNASHSIKLTISATMRAY